MIAEAIRANTWIRSVTNTSSTSTAKKQSAQIHGSEGFQIDTLMAIMRSNPRKYMDQK